MAKVTKLTEDGVMSLAGGKVVMMTTDQLRQLVLDGMSLSTRNLLAGANKEIVSKGTYNVGNYAYSEAPEVGKVYTLTVCYTLDSLTAIRASIFNGNLFQTCRMKTRGEKVIESFTFEVQNHKIPSSLGFYTLSVDELGSGDVIHWAVLTKGVTPAASEWIPAAGEIYE